MDKKLINKNKENYLYNSTLNVHNNNRTNIGYPEKGSLAGVL